MRSNRSSRYNASIFEVFLYLTQWTLEQRRFNCMRGFVLVNACPSFDPRLGVCGLTVLLQAI